MGPEVRGSSKVKRKAVRTMRELKREIIAKNARGVHVSDLAPKYGLEKLTMGTIL